MRTSKRDHRIAAAAVAAALSVAAALPAFAEKPPFSRYQTIVDRLMFGPLPADFDPTKLPSEVARTSASAAGKAAQQLTKEQEKLKSAIRFSVINVTPQGDVAVGFTDSSEAKNPKHYYLKKGEERDGWLVKEADPETATMTIAKGEIEVTLSIGQDSAKGGSAKAGPASQPGAANASAGPAPRKSSLLTRRLQRKEQERAQIRREVSEEMRKEREAEAAKEEAQRAAEKAEADAKREEDKQRFQDMRSELETMRQRMQEEKKAKEAEEASGGGDGESEE